MLTLKRWALTFTILSLVLFIVCSSPNDPEPDPPKPKTLSAPSLISPQNGATLENLTPTFDWSNVDDADTYDFALNDTRDMTNAKLIIDDLSASSYILDGEFEAGTYYWSARSQSSDGVTSEWAKANQFTIKKPDNSENYDQLILGAWRGSYIDGTYQITSEYTFTESNEMTSYTTFVSSVNTNFYTWYKGDYQINVNNDSYYVQFSFTEYNVPQNITPFLSGYFEFRFNSNGKLEVWMQTSTGYRWIVYDKII